jgi:hypothetical protein
LAGIPGEYHLRALADTGEDCFQRGWFEVLGFVNDNDLSM